PGFSRGGRVASARPAVQRPPSAEAEIFAAHRGRPADELRIGDPAKDEVSGKVLIQVSRPVLDSGGTLSGVIAVGVSPEALRRLYENLELGPKGFVAIRRLADTPFLRYPAL